MLGCRKIQAEVIVFIYKVFFFFKKKGIPGFLNLMI